MNKPRDMVSRLAELGYRLTPQRMLVLAAIENSDGHISAEEIYAQVVAKYPHVNISTVYRTLDLLKRLGLVTETDMGGGRVRYHPAVKGHHHHLICSNCGLVIDFTNCDLKEVEQDLFKETGFRIDGHLLEFIGLCQTCQEKKQHGSK